VLSHRAEQTHSNHDDLDLLRDKDSLMTDQAVDSIAFAHPHPPRFGPSAGKSVRRKPRIRSRGSSNVTASDSANGFRHGAAGASAVPTVPVNVNVVATDEEVQQFLKVITRQKQLRSESESEASSHCESLGGADESDESLSEVISALKEEKLTTTSTADRVYIYASRPTSIAAPRTKAVSQAKLVLDLAKKHGQISDANGTEIKKNSTRTSNGNVGNMVDNGSEDDIDDISQSSFCPGSAEPIEIGLRQPSPPDGTAVSQPCSLEGATVSPSLEGTTSSTHRVSVMRSSLREIPQDELRRSGGEKTYVVAKYQVANELSESSEHEMLQALRRSSDTEIDDNGDNGENPALDITLASQSELQFGNNTITDWSDEDTITQTSHVKSYPKYRASHDYFEEMKNFVSPLRLSNQSDWDSTMSSHTFMSPSGTFNGLHDDGLFTASVTLEIPQVTQSKPLADTAGTRHKQQLHQVSSKHTDELLDVLYDADLQCYYDPRTHKYYKLRSQCDFPFQSPR
jgi:hypothetical protein